MHSPLLTAALQYRLTAALCHCIYTYGDLLFIQVCSDPTPEHCNTVFCKWHSPVLSAALQDRLAAGLYHCKYTYEDLLCIQVCSEPTPVHCITVQSKMQSPQLSAALQDRLAAGLYHCNYIYEDLLFIQVCSDPTPEALQHCFLQMAFPSAQCCSARQACSRLVSLQVHLWRFAAAYRCAVTQHQHTASLFFAKCSAH